jgi:L-threonylcarbamoyladenylate synthase
MKLVSLSDLVTGALSGQLVSFPTDTVPALAVRPDCSELIFAAKGRSHEKPLILMGDSWSSLLPFVNGTETELETWRQVTEQYWPGALTLVLPASAQVPAVMNPTDSATIGVRVPSSQIAIAILSQTGPLATTSANRSGEPALMTMAAIAAQFPDVLTFYGEHLDKLDVRPAESVASSELATSQTQLGVPSTVAKWTKNGWQILRQGSVEL